MDYPGATVTEVTGINSKGIITGFAQVIPSTGALPAFGFIGTPAPLASRSKLGDAYGAYRYPGSTAFDNRARTPLRSLLAEVLAVPPFLTAHRNDSILVAGRYGRFFVRMKLLASLSALLAVRGSAQCPSGCTVNGDVSGTVPTITVQKVSGATTGTALPSTCTLGEYLNFNFIESGSSTPITAPYWCNPANVWMQFPLLDSSGNLTVACNSGTTTTGSVIIFSQGGGQATVTVSTTLSTTGILTLPAGTTTLAGLGIPNAFTGANTHSGSEDFTQGTLIVPNSGTTAPTTEAQAGYNTTQHDYVAGGYKSTSGSFPRVISFQVPAPAPPDLLCRAAAI